MNFPNIFEVLTRSMGEVIVQVAEAPERIVDALEDIADRILDDTTE